MKRAGLTVEVPGDSSTAGTGTEGQAIDPSGPSNSAPSVSSARQRGRFSPGAYMQKAASVLGITSRTPSRASSKQGYAGGRASVNPIQRAANDATYRHSLELTEQNAAAVADFKKKKKPSKRHSQKELITQDEEVRYVRHNEGPVGEFETNKVVTSKYNVITFLPYFLFEMFSRAAYMYFLLQAALSWWSVVSPFGGVGSTAALLFVLVVAGVKAVWEDTKRHQEDKRMNTSITHRVNEDGSVTDIPWTDVQVGDYLMVKDDELFPADLVCIYSALPDKVCFIKTTNLDGETNLKIRRPLDTKGVPVESIKAAVDLRFTLMAELPNKNLHKFRGKLSLKVEDGSGGAASGQPATVPENAAGVVAGVRESPVTMSEMLLRGCMLKNSHYVVGMVVYTGKETRIQMNAARTPLKVGSFDRFLNLQISLVIFMQICMAIFCAIANYIWQVKEGRKHYYLALNYNVEGIYESPVAQICINFLTFWILLSYLVPISLFVTMEIVKFWQGFVFINFDPHMKDPKTGEAARCRNSGLNEDLGKVEYVFSDKTGTLTSNEMQLRMIAIKGVPYGTLDFRLEDHPKLMGTSALKRFDARLYKAAQMVQKKEGSSAWNALLASGGSDGAVMAHPSSFPKLAAMPEDYETVAVMPDGIGEPGDGAGSQLGHHLVDFWTNICICQSLIIEDNPKGGLPIYQGPSPDEVALVEAARQVGFEFKNRSMSSVTLNIFGEDIVFELLNVMEYTSERGCMSVIARAPDGTIRIYCKGSDTRVMAKLRDKGQEPMPPLYARTEENLSMFARQGLRTLVLATKIIPEDDYLEWDSRYQEAAASFEDRDGKMNALGAEIEQNLELIGVTAIEDKLQDGVPMAINTLLEAGVKVWMITGDKQETAINIGVACKLVSNPESIMILNVNEKQEAKECEREAREKLQMLLDKTAKLLEVDANGDVAPVGELAVDGPTLNFILADKNMTKQLADLSSRCSSVVICRSSPSQKAAIVRMMMEYELREAAGSSWGVWRWYKRYKRRLAGKMLSIGDGANDVAMIQTADVGVGIMGKEGRQAVNNSDYAIAQFRFLVPLLLIHGNLSYYRLARLIKYSFYKNITFAFVLFYYQFYNGFSGQALVDSITAAVFNVVFTSMPILLFSILDRPVKNLNAFIRYPQLYDKRHLGSLTTSSFWKTGVLLAMIHGAICFFLSYYSIAISDQNSIVDVYSLGKIAFVAMLGSVTLEVCLTARYWTWLFGIFTFLSFFLVYPFITIFPLLELAIGYYDPANVGVGEQIMRSPTFWFVTILTYILTFGMRFAERTWVWVFRPHDTMILAEKERKDGLMSNLSAPSRKRLSELGLPAWRGCAGKDAPGVLDEERGEGGSASSHPSPSSRSAASGRQGKEEEGDADSQSLRSHYSGMGSPQQSNHSGSLGLSRRTSPGANGSGSGNGAAKQPQGGNPTPALKLSEFALRDLSPSSRQGSQSQSGPADSLEAWAQQQPSPSSASSKRVTFDKASTPGRTPRG